MLLARLALVAAVVAAPALPLSLRRKAAPQRRSSSIALRRRLHVNTLITEPGTVEVEWNNVFSTGGAFAMPVTVKFTPEGRHILWGRTEFSANFDLVSSVSRDGSRETGFSDHATLSANCVVLDGEKLDIAIAPQFTALLRGGQGVRAGATAIARYDWGRNSGGVTATWTGATAASADNPAGTYDLGAGYGRRLAAAGPLSHITAFGNLVHEKSTGFSSTRSLSAGAEYQISEKVALDLSAQRLSVAPGPVDYQFLAGLTVNLGRPRRWFGGQFR